MSRPFRPNHITSPYLCRRVLRLAPERAPDTVWPALAGLRLWGVLYLTVYAAARFYDLLPYGLAFAVMSCLVVLAGIYGVDRSKTCE